MIRTANENGEEYGQLTFDFFSMICPQMSAAKAVSLFEESKPCRECGRRAFDVYVKASGEVGIEIKCMQCKKIISIPILTLVKENS